MKITKVQLRNVIRKLIKENLATSNQAIPDDCLEHLENLGFYEQRAGDTWMIKMCARGECDDVADKAERIVAQCGAQATVSISHPENVNGAMRWPVMVDFSIR